MPDDATDELLRRLGAEPCAAVELPLLTAAHLTGRAPRATAERVPVSFSPGRRPRRGTFAFRVADGSMAPDLREDDLLVVRPGHRPRDGHAVVAVRGDDVLVRRLVARDGARFLVDAAGALVPVDDTVRIVGVVRWYTRKLDR